MDPAILQQGTNAVLEMAGMGYIKPRSNGPVDLTFNSKVAWAQDTRQATLHESHKDWRLVVQILTDFPPCRTLLWVCVREADIAEKAVPMRPLSPSPSPPPSKNTRTHTQVTEVDAYELEGTEFVLKPIPPDGLLGAVAMRRYRSMEYLVRGGDCARGKRVGAGERGRDRRRGHGVDTVLPPLSFLQSRRLRSFREAFLDVANLMVELLGANSGPVPMREFLYT